jgi:H+/Cl- antiporter ClcA
MDKIKDNLMTCAAALLVGCAGGAFAALFGRVLLAVGDLRDKYLLYLVPFLFVGGIFTYLVYKKWGGTASKGMSLIFDAANGSGEDIPACLIPLVMVCTWVAHLLGASAGREGVAVQIGGAVGDIVGRKIKSSNRSVLISAGMAAGFSGLFGTPFTAVFFAMEVLCVGKLNYRAAVPIVIGSVASYIVSGALGLERFKFAVDSVGTDYTVMLKAAFLGAVFGIVGAIFAFLLKLCKKKVGELKIGSIKKIVILSALLSAILLAFGGRYCGLGTNLISYSLNGDKIYLYDFALKLLLTVFTLSIGFQGGEVTPLFSIGASLGAVLSAYMGLPVAFCAALGYCGVFGGASNTLFAPLLIGCEVFGWENAPCFLICCGCAYIFSGNISIYKQKRE